MLNILINTVYFIVALQKTMTFCCVSKSLHLVLKYFPHWAECHCISHTVPSLANKYVSTVLHSQGAHDCSVNRLIPTSTEILRNSTCGLWIYSLSLSPYIYIYSQYSSTVKQFSPMSHGVYWSYGRSITLDGSTLWVIWPIWGSLFSMAYLALISMPLGWEDNVALTKHCKRLSQGES